MDLIIPNTILSDGIPLLISSSTNFLTENTRNVTAPVFAHRVSLHGLLKRSTWNLAKLCKFCVHLRVSVT